MSESASRIGGRTEISGRFRLGLGDIPGEVVHVTVAPRHVHVLDADTGLAITE